MAQQGEEFKYLQASALTSPRNLSAEDKIAHANQYRIKSKEFGDLVNEYVLLFLSICRLTNKLYAAGKGSRLIFDMGNDSVMELRYKHIVSAQKLFRSALIKLKNFYRGSRKRPVSTTTKGGISAIGAPVYFGDANNALMHLFSKQAEFGNKTPESNVTLISELEGIKSGYGLRTTLALLFFVHAMVRELAHQDNAQFIKSSDAMMEAFGRIPAKFDAYDNGKGELLDGTNRKVKAELVPMGSDNGVMKTTYQVLGGLYQGKYIKSGKKGTGLVPADFNPARFATYHFQLLISLNSYSEKRLLAFSQEQGGQAFREPYSRIIDEDVKQSLKDDHELVQNARDAWKHYRDQNAAQRAGIRKAAQKTVRENESRRKQREKVAMEQKRERLLGIVSSPRP